MTMYTLKLMRLIGTIYPYSEATELQEGSRFDRSALKDPLLSIRYIINSFFILKDCAAKYAFGFLKQSSIITINSKI